MKHVFTLLAICALLTIGSASAGPVTYQGRLTDSNGQSVSGERTVIFSLYNSEAAPEDPVWTSEPTAVQVADGLFTAGFEPPPSTIAAHPDLWMGVTVEGAPLLPRVRLGTVPFAMVAGSVAQDGVGSSQLASDPYSLFKISSGLLDSSSMTGVTSNGDITFSQPGQGIYFADGTSITSAAAAGSIPQGASVLSRGIGAPSGYTYSGAYIGSLDSDIWTGRATPPAPASGQCAAAAVGQVMYVTGGTSREFVTSAYDTLTDTWSSRANMLAGRRLHGCVEFGGKIYVFGGLYGSTAIASAEMYDPDTNQWSAIAPLPSARGGVAAAAVNGLIYSIGGFDVGFNPIANVDVYDPASNAWSPAAALPSTRYYAAACVFNGAIYLAGGATLANGQSPDLLVYDPGSDTWSPRASMARGRFGLALQAVGDRLYAIGGRDSGAGNYLDNESYDPWQDRWFARRNQPTYRHSCGSAVVNDRIYCALGTGGQPNGGSALQTMEMYTPPTIFYVHTKD